MTSSSARQMSELNRPKQLTHGEEYEGLVAFKWDDDDDPDEADSQHLAPLTRIPKPNPDFIPPTFPLTVPEEDLLQYYCAKIIHERVRDTLRDYGFPVIGDELLDENDDQRLAPFRGFDVEWDSTVTEVADFRYMWCSIEIKTPVNPDTPEAYEITSHAINLLVSKYRFKVNETCGLHVHVGNGPDWFPLNSIKRIAAFFWAADPILGCLHPPERRYNIWIPSIRERSELAKGTVVIDKLKHVCQRRLCQRYYGQQVRYGEYPMVWRYEHKSEAEVEAFENTRLPGHFEPYQGLDPDHTLGTSSSEAPFHSAQETMDVNEQQTEEPMVLFTLQDAIESLSDRSSEYTTEDFDFQPSWQREMERISPLYSSRYQGRENEPQTQPMNLFGQSSFERQLEPLTRNGPSCGPESQLD
ncbi:hypothetical protein BJ170DRAFT_680300 [Xylariales sp. AK1849]|nr:hypothetical protein BJ170DRAFT_680300 [Xylariales sp. AK1849]